MMGWCAAGHFHVALMRVRPFQVDDVLLPSIWDDLHVSVIRFQRWRFRIVFILAVNVSHSVFAFVSRSAVS
jgi:hypothetical protein